MLLCPLFPCNRRDGSIKPFNGEMNQAISSLVSTDASPKELAQICIFSFHCPSGSFLFHSWPSWSLPVLNGSTPVAISSYIFPLGTMSSRSNSHPPMVALAEISSPSGPIFAIIIPIISLRRIHQTNYRK